MITIKTTFQRVTPESAENGDFSETGWHDEQGENFDNAVDAVLWLQRQGAVHPSSSNFHNGIWYSSDEHCSDYSTDETTSYSFHIKASKKLQLEIYNRLIGID